MYCWTEEACKLADEVRDYIVNGKATEDAPEGTQEKYERMKMLVDAERKRMIDLL